MMNRSMICVFLCSIAACGTTATIPEAGDGGGSGVNDGGSTPEPDATSAPVDASASDAAEAGAPGCAAKPLPTSCAAAATTFPAAGDYGGVGSFAITVETLANPHPSAPANKPVTMYLPSGKRNSPVLFFSHAYAATDVAVYDSLFRRVASHGYAIVHVPYAPIPPGDAKNATRYAQLWDGFVAAVARNPLDLDTTRVGFVGHSFGGGATPELARRGFVERGWGSNGKMMAIFAPWYSWGTGHGTLPADVRTIVQVYADDAANDHVIAREDVWNKIPQIVEKRWLLVRTDTCECGLLANHVAPMTAAQAQSDGERDNGLDAWAVARRLHALAAYTFEGKADAKAIAFADEPSLGRWVGCGGRAVTPIESATSPIVASCGAPYEYPYADRCKNADPGVCP